MKIKDSEICSHAFEIHSDYQGAMIPPIYQTSIFTYENYESFSVALENQREQYVYSRGLNPTVKILEDKLAALERGEMCKAFGSGMGAISATMMALLKSGDHVLLVNQIYGPTFELLENLKEFGITFDQTSNDLDEIEAAIKENTKMIYIESPSSMLMEIVDLKAISKLAKSKGILTALDNSWATPIFQKPLTLGIDLSIHSLSKYISGHSDVVAGAVIGSKLLVDKIFKKGLLLFGASLSPQNAFLILRGMRTLPIRMEKHQSNVLKVIEYLQAKDEIGAIHHPSVLTGDMKKVVSGQLDGYSGLLSFELKKGSFDHIASFINAFSIIKIGVSWGGYESLVISQVKMNEENNTSEQGVPGLIRLAVGLEEPELLINDFEKGFTALTNK